MKMLLSVWLLLITHLSFAMPVGFNQAWFKNDYGTQYLDSHFDETEVRRIFKLAKGAGADNLRLWLFESAHFPMLEWKQDKLVGIRPDFIKNFLKTLQIAKDHDVKVYMTFFDAHVYRPDKLGIKGLKRVRYFYQPQGGVDFLTKVVAPLFKAIEAAKLTSSISRIDLSNEVDAVINRWGFNHGWTGAGRMLCQWRNFIQSIGTFRDIPVSFSLRLHSLIFHPRNLLHDQGPMACADYFDFHSYADNGEIHRCQYLKNYADQKKKKLVLGEFGQSYFNHRYDNDLQKKNTAAYLVWAERCGFSEALAWRLSDVRPGRNKEARYSFEAFGEVRPAYRVIEEHNRKH